jgi:hypothetical protein
METQFFFLFFSLHELEKQDSSSRYFLLSGKKRLKENRLKDVFYVLPVIDVTETSAFF